MKPETRNSNSRTAETLSRGRQEGARTGVLQPDTRKLLATGLLIFGIGVVAAFVVRFASGGVSRQGPHTNTGWLALMLAMGCLPTGLLTLLLATAKVLGDRSRR